MLICASELGLAELKSRAFEAGVFDLLGVYLSFDARTAYYQVAHSRERSLRSLFNLLCYFRGGSEGKLLWNGLAGTNYCYQVEVKYFLDHWAEIRGSDAMRSVWHQIRLGRHPGFEEGLQMPPLYRCTIVDLYSSVWPVIATNLEFKPQTNGAGSDREDSNRQS